MAKLKLNDSFSKQQLNYIRYYLCQTNIHNQIYIGSQSLRKFLSRLTYNNPKDNNEQIHIQSKQQRKQLVNKLIVNIMNDQQAFIGIIMSQAPIVHALSTYPTTKQFIPQIMEKIVKIIKQNKQARQQLINSIVDIDITTKIQPTTFSKHFLKALYDTNDLRRFIKNVYELSDQIKRFPKLSPFFIHSIIKDQVLFNMIFTQQQDLQLVNSALQKVDIKLPENKKNQIKQRILQNMKKTQKDQI